MTEENSTTAIFGARLRAEREERQISLEAISRVTKISIHLLHAMENDDWDSLPGGIFTRNFIRLYADYIGLEAEEWVENFRHYFKTTKRTEGEEAHESEELVPKLNLPQGWLYALIAFTIVLLIGGYFLITMIQNEFQQEETATNDTPAVRTEIETVDEGEVILPQENNTTALTVELEDTTGTSPWYMITSDGFLHTQEGGERLAVGEKKTFTADETIKLFIVRRQGVKIRINGSEVDWNSLDTVERVDENGNVSYVVNITATSAN